MPDAAADHPDYEHSAEYMSLEWALKSRWAPFQTLLGEMDQFSPPSAERLAKEQTAAFEHLKRLNPGQPDDKLLELASSISGAKSSPAFWYSLRFRDRYMAEYVTILFLSHALCEAAINAILALGFAKRGAPDLFAIMERADLRQKWCVALKALSSDYDLPKASALHETLVQLVKQRNSLVHYKIDLKVKGQRVLQGSQYRPEYADTPWVLRFFSLPYDLVAHANRCIGHPIFIGIHDRGPIEPVLMHGQV